MTQIVEQILEKIIEMQCLDEGVNDKHIFKAFFLAGGPGSGKSYVSRKALGGEGLKVVNSDDIFEYLLNKAGLSLKMPDDEAEERDTKRNRAKALTAMRQKNYLEGRLGVIVDGTGKDFNKITKQANALKELGYDTHMIFVNTSLDIAHQRNKMRSRSVPNEIVEKGWRDVQSNLDKFKAHFGANFILVNNDKADSNLMLTIIRHIKKLLAKPVKNQAALNWIKAHRP